MRGFLLFGAWVGVCLASAGCSGQTGSDGGDGGDGGSGPGNVTTGKGFCDGTFGTIVDYLDKNCSAQDKQADTYLFVYALLSGATQECATVLQSSIDNGRATLDANAAASCVDGYRQALEAASNLDSLDKTVSQKVQAACKSAITGKQAIGAACAQSYECGENATCVGYTGSTDGTCQTPAIGEACGKGENTSGEATITLTFSPHPECANGYCDSVYENSEFVHRCVALKPAGEACSDEKECQTGLRCQVGKCSTEGPAQVGGACKIGDDCVDGSYCSNDTHLCAAKKQTGQTCNASLFGGSECEGTCQAAEGADTGTCVAFCGTG